MSRRSLARSTVLGMAAAGFFALAGCDVDVKEEGRLPDVNVSGGQAPDIDVKPGTAPDVDVTAGQAPDVDVRGPDVDVTPQKRTVTVPDVEIKTEEKTISVPDVDVNIPAENDESASPEGES